MKSFFFSLFYCVLEDKAPLAKETSASEPIAPESSEVDGSEAVVTTSDSVEPSENVEPTLKDDGT